MSNSESFDSLGWKHNIGDIVAVQGSCTVTDIPPHRFWDGNGDTRYVVVSRMAEQCPGGIQLNYHCRAISPDGAAAENRIQFLDVEVQASEPFRVLTEEEYDARREAKKDKA